MNARLSQRLNQILPRIEDEGFLQSHGIGNEIACYIFDYDPADELHVREHVQLVRKHLSQGPKRLDVLHLDLLDVVLDYLRSRDLLVKVLRMESDKGDAAVLRALKGPLAAEKIRDFIGEKYTPSQADLVLMTGVGSVWPVLRTHSLLNSLHTIMGQTPLVMFYPGRFDGTALRLFGRMAAESHDPLTKPYYRAFRLIPEEA